MRLNLEAGADVPHRVGLDAFLLLPAIHEGRMNPDALRSRCSMHTDGVSSRSCSRCGSFLCEICTPGVHCAACIEIVEFQAQSRLLAQLQRGMLIGIATRILLLVGLAVFTWVQFGRFKGFGAQAVPFLGLAALHLMTRAPLVSWAALALDVLIFGRLAAVQLLMWPLLEIDSRWAFQALGSAAACATLIAASAVRAVRIGRVQRRIHAWHPRIHAMSQAEEAR